MGAQVIDDRSYAERLRGGRFWYPLIALVAATVAGAVALTDRTTPTTTSPPAQVASAGPQLQVVLDRLTQQGVFCGAPEPAGPAQVSCRFGAATAPAAVQVFPSHAGALAALRRTEHASVSANTRTGAVTYLSIAKDTVVTGIWSSIGNYAAAQSGDGQAAEAVNKAINGCLELLPKQAGSCAF